MQLIYFILHHKIQATAWALLVSFVATSGGQPPDRLALKLTYVGPQDAVTPSVVLRTRNSKLALGDFRTLDQQGPNYLNDSAAQLIECEPGVLLRLVESLRRFEPVRQGQRQELGYLSVSVLEAGRTTRFLQAFLDESNADSVFAVVHEQCSGIVEAQASIRQLGERLGILIATAADSTALDFARMRDEFESWTGRSYDLVNVSDVFSARIEPADDRPAEPGVHSWSSAWSVEADAPDGHLPASEAFCLLQLSPSGRLVPGSESRDIGRSWYLVRLVAAPQTRDAQILSGRFYVQSRIPLPSTPLLMAILVRSSN
jgi:hypothetical protein